MRIGILADIHGDTENLKRAITQLRRKNTDVFLVLGDVIYDRTNAAETVALLEDCDAIGVWGNHELGLCVDPEPEVLAGYCESVTRFFGTLQPQLELDGYLFSHTYPCEDARDPMSYYVARRPYEEGALNGCFSKFNHNAMMIGHFHSWFAANRKGRLRWRGKDPVKLDPTDQYFFVIAAVMNGHAALLDSEQKLLIPLSV